MGKLFLVFQGQGRSGRSGSGRHRTSRSPERQVMYSQQQAEQLRRKQQQQQGQPRQHHPQQQQQQQQYPQQYGGAGKYLVLLPNCVYFYKCCDK